MPMQHPSRARPAPLRREAGSGRPTAFAAGLGCGLFAAFLVYLTGWLPEPQPSPATASGESGAAGAEAGERGAPRVRFEFPEVLRDAEVLVPFVEEYLQAPPSEPPAGDVEYLLQAGAFKKPEDAERRRAEILLLGLEASTLEVTRSGRTWHRVLVGPFPSRDAVRDAQTRLLEEDIDSITLKARPEAESGA